MGDSKFKEMKSEFGTKSKYIRPIYGYMHINDSSGAKHALNLYSNYQMIRFEFNENIVDRTTMTFYNSSYYSVNKKNTLLLKDKGVSKIKNLSNEKENNWLNKRDYKEQQVYGGFDATDVKAVHFHKSGFKSLENELKEKGYQVITHY